MKIYTEEQVKESFKSGFRLAMETDGGLKEGQEEFINSLIPIQLPSDEEIRVQAVMCSNKWEEYRAGAKWIKEQILKQNKWGIKVDATKSQVTTTDVWSPKTN